MTENEFANLRRCERRGEKSEEGWVLILFLLQTSNLTIVIQEFGTLGF